MKVLKPFVIELEASYPYPRLIGAGVRDSAAEVVAVDPIPTDMVARLVQEADPRARHGVRHLCATVLAIGVGAVLAGARTFTETAEWAADLTPMVGRVSGWAWPRPYPEDSRYGRGRRDAPAVAAPGPSVHAVSRCGSAALPHPNASRLR